MDALVDSTPHATATIVNGNLEIHLRNPNNRKFVIAALLVIATLFAASPIVLIFLVKYSFTIAYLITIVICWSCSAFFFRLFLWNNVGKDVFIVSRNRISHSYHYKFFKDDAENLNFIEIRAGLKCVNLDGVVFNLNGLKEHRIDFANLVFATDAGEITSHHLVDVSILSRIQYALQVITSKEKIQGSNGD